MITNKTKTVQLKMREARFWPKMKFEPIFFQILWQFFNPKGSLLPAIVILRKNLTIFQNCDMI
jgi:hypothetical protein